jgi:hypothetical protein
VTAKIIDLGRVTDFWPVNAIDRIGRRIALLRCIGE